MFKLLQRGRRFYVSCTLGAGLTFFAICGLIGTRKENKSPVTIETWEGFTDLWRKMGSVPLDNIYGQDTVQPVQRELIENGEDDFYMETAYIPSQTERKLSLERLLARVASPDRTVVIALTDTSAEQMTMNFYLTSLQPHNITNYVFISTEPNHCKNLHARRITCFTIGNDTEHLGLTESKGLLLGTKEYLRRMKLRLETWMLCLSLGYNILAVDVDMIFLKNPFLWIKAVNGRFYDVYFMYDSPTKINAGFMLILGTVNVLHRLENAQRLLEANHSMDDQTAINHAFSSAWHKSIYRLPNKEFSSGLTYWENKVYGHEFKDEMALSSSVVVHNNFLISLEAKMYRMRESGMWVMDADKYYSDPNRKYITYNNPFLFPKESYARVAEVTALRNALAFAQILNRTLILPKFRCGLNKFPNLKKYKNCNLLHRLKVRKFEKYFPNYREHSFLLHKLVPLATKNSSSDWICLNVSNRHVTKNITGKCKTWISLLSPGKGATQKEILSYFEGSPHKILRFYYMYGTFSNFGDAKVEAEFTAKCKQGLINCDYRQIGSKKSKH